MVGYLTIAAKMVLNVHDLNNEGSVGQSLDIRQIRMVDELGNPLPEMPAVSGRMMKHWHLEHVRRRALETNTDLCDTCRSGQPDRQTEAEDELEAIKGCAICDIHGFLSTKKIKNAPRRSSCASFSWLLPVIATKPETKQVIHSRVSSGTETTSGSDETAQMIFNKTYASGMFGLVASLDFSRIGKTIDNRDIGNGILKRQLLAVRAFLPICIGAFGASQSHALPHTKCLSLLAAISASEKPLPNLISPIYSTGIEDSITLLKSLGNKVQWWTYGIDDNTNGKCSSVSEVFDAIIKVIDGNTDQSENSGKTHAQPQEGKTLS